MEIRGNDSPTCKGCASRDEKLRVMSIEMDNLKKLFENQKRLIENFKNPTSKNVAIQQDSAVPLFETAPICKTEAGIMDCEMAGERETDPLSIPAHQFFNVSTDVEVDKPHADTFKLIDIKPNITLRAMDPTFQTIQQPSSSTNCDNQHTAEKVKGLTYIHVYTKTSKSLTRKAVNSTKKNKPNQIAVNPRNDVMSHTTTKTSSIRHGDSPLFLKPFKCGTCSKSFAVGNKLSEHINEVHNKCIYQCPICKMVLKFQKTFVEHVKSHDENIYCEICNGKVSKKEVDKHLCSKQDKNITCEYCDLKAISTKRILEHLKSHQEDIKMYKCSQCPKFFGMQVLMRYHQRQHENVVMPHKAVSKRLNVNTKPDVQREDLCEQCGKSFSSKHSLNVHMRTHSEPTIQCPECPQKFRTMLYLKRHSHIHRNVKYVCPICKFSGSSPARLKDHMTMQHDPNQVPVECKICLRIVKNNKILKGHMRRHKDAINGRERFQCDFCDTSYKYKGDLNRHLKVHLGDNIHKCDQCDKSFKYPMDLQRHSFEHYKEKQAQNSTTN